MSHSERVFKAIKGFQKQNLYMIYNNDKINETMAHQDEWQPELEKKMIQFIRSYSDKPLLQIRRLLNQKRYSSSQFGPVF